MPHVGGSSAEDLASSDEIKVFASEEIGDEKDEKGASADLTDLKSNLITECNQEKSSQAFSSKSSSQQSTSHHQNGHRTESTSNFGKAFDPPLGYPFGYPLTHSPYHNGTFGQMANKMAAAAVAAGAPHPASPLPFMMPNMEPPPAHMGIPPVMRCETKANISMWMDIDFSNLSGFPRNPLYGLPGSGQSFPSSSLLSDIGQLNWANPAMYHQLQQAAMRGQYPLASVSPSAFPGFGRTPLMPHPSLSGHSPFSHPGFLPSATSSNVSANSSLINGPSHGSKLASRCGSTPNGSLSSLLVNGSTNGDFRVKQEHSPQPVTSGGHRQLGGSSPSSGSDPSNNNNPSMSNKNRSNSDYSDSNGSSKLGKHSPGSRSQSSNGTARSEGLKQGQGQGQGHIKKPLNAFMIYMKEMRAKVIAESTLKESAAINQILGKKWHSLTRAEQETYYDKARKERELHMEMHPGWTAKDNYAINAKRKKKKRERNADGERGALKKCRARYGLDQQNHWCKPCRRKKKCIRYLEALRAARESEGRRHELDVDDNLGSVGSVEAPTPESKSTNESDHDNLNSNDLSLSSPPTSEYHHFMSSFNPFSGGPVLNSGLHLNGNGHLTSPSLFYPHHNSPSSLNSPLGSRMSSLLTPNSPLASLSNFSSSSPLGPPISAAPGTPNPSQMPPRNSPFSIEQLVGRPHQTCASSRSSSSGASISKLLNGGSKSAGHSVSVITQLPTPPSSTDSTNATPTMLSVA